MPNQQPDSPLRRLLDDIKTYTPDADQPELTDLQEVVPPLVDAAIRLDDQERRREMVETIFRCVAALTVAAMTLLAFVLVAPVIWKGYVVPPWVPQLLGMSGLLGMIGLVVRFLTGPKAAEWMFPSTTTPNQHNGKSARGPAIPSRKVKRKTGEVSQQLLEAKTSGSPPGSAINNVP